jgi:glutathione peroxidase-family protein
MKHFIIPTVLILLLTAAALPPSIYTYTVPKIEGGTQPLSAVQGRRLLVITLPVQQSAAADTLLYCLDTLATAHSSNLFVIGVPAIEDGYTAAQKTALTTWYRSKLNTNIIITDGLYTRKTSGSQQQGLFKWLTTDSLNGIFDNDIVGPGHKFFVKVSGDLYGQLSPQTKISGHAVQRTLQIQ